MKSLTDLGLSSELAKTCETKRPWYFAMKFQREVIPSALQQGNDVFGISPPRSGKTVAFVLPILQALLETGPNLTPFFACVLYSTRSLASQTADHFEALGSKFGIQCAIIAGENRQEHESILNSEQPHIILGRPDLILYHLKHTNGFSLALASLKYLVIDDAHLLSYENILHDILEISRMIPRERRTFLFSSSFTNQVHTMLSMCLRNPVKIDLSSKYSIADTLQQSCFMQENHKDCYLVYTLAEMTGRKYMVYTQLCGTTLLLALILKNLGFRVIPIISCMSQAKKLGSLNAFKSGECNILICSDFVSKGLDIPEVDMVINYNIPWYPNDYIYRVGWTVAHVNVAISFVIPDERRHFNMIEKHIGKKLPLYPAPFEEVLLLEGRVSEAERLAQEEMKEFGWGSGGYLEEEEGGTTQE